MAIKPTRKSDPDLEVPVEGTSVETYNYREQLIESLIDAHLIYDGQVSGRHYEWNGGGSSQLVDERDVPALLAKRMGERSCCGAGLQGNLVFRQI